MKYLKMLGLAAVAATALMALVASSASATELTSPSGTRLKTGTTIHVVSSGIIILTTSFLNIECKESTVHILTSNETGASINGNVTSLTWGGCNCEVKTLAGGTLSITGGLGNSNGNVSSSGAEVTAQCNTIFGAVHCIYKTNATALGTLTGSTTTGGTAKLDVSSANIPRLSTSALCAEKAVWHVTFIIDGPDVIIVD